ncbi:MAG TPA: HlyD family efflux transporter periplasmic adaptor subunit [Blastocatellia bacterium]|nr:HlyD family efflux transporter periplasmic adaptor subunit [Blastocatellia bacterium]
MLSPSSNLRALASSRMAPVISACLLLVLLAPIFIYRFNFLSFNRFLASPSDATNNADGTVAPAVEVKRGSVRKILLLDGELRAVRSRTIYGASSDEAKIVYMPPEGTVVKAGDLVVELDSTNITTRIKDTDERIVAAENEIVRVKSQHESALRDLEVELSRLWLVYEQAKLKAKIPNEVISRREYQEAQLALEKSKTEYENHLNKIEQKKKEQAAELQVKAIEKDKLKVQLDRAKNDLDGMRIKAPTEGMALYNDHWNERRKLQIGDVVWGGWPVIQLPDLTEMEVLAQVNEVDGPRLSIGAKAEIKLDSYPDKVITGKIADISQTAIKASRMGKAKIFRVTISLDKTLMEIMKPGMSAQVLVIINETQPNLLIPRSTVKSDGESAKVMRIENAEARREVAVTILAADALNYLVAENGALKEGDRILSK